MQTLQNGGRRSIAALGVVLVALILLAPMALRAAPTAQVVMDARTGQILHARNHDTRLHPASLTKMMTLYIAFEAVRNGEIGLDTPVRVSANAAGQPCSCLGLKTGQTIALRHLIRAAAVRSGNDAATAIGEAISGSEAAFIARMNRTAQALGMTNTSFRNAHGLTASGHLSTARDMTTLGRQLYFDFPEYYNLFSRSSADAGVRTVTNTNRAFLNGYDGADGIKTGYTRAAGFNLTASARRGERHVIVTVFGGQSVPDRTRRVTGLMDLGFERAPRRAAVRRPPPPDYGSTPPGGVAMAAAGNRPAAGRTIRIDTAVRRSPVPRLRPSPAEDPPAVAGLALGIETAIAAVAAPPDTEAAAGDSAPQPEPRPAGLTATLPFAVADAAEAPPSASTRDARAIAAAALPFALAEAAADTPAEDIPFAIADAAAPEPEADMSASPLAVASAPLPLPRPDPSGPATADLPDETHVTVALAPTEADPAPTGTRALETASAGSSAQAVTALVRPAAAAIAPPAAAAPAPAPRSQADGASLVVLTYAAIGVEEAGSGLASLARTGRAQPNLAAANAGDELTEEVTRTVSTSSPRLWAVAIGRYPNRDAAERALIRSALADLGTLDTAPRRIEQGSGGFEASFVGLTETGARGACGRLAARGQDCQPVGP